MWWWRLWSISVRQLIGFICPKLAAAAQGQQDLVAVLEFLVAVSPASFASLGVVHAIPCSDASAYALLRAAFLACPSVGTVHSDVVGLHTGYETKSAPSLAP